MEKILIVLMLLSHQAFAQTSVTTLEQNTVNHIERVGILGIYLYERSPGDFPGLSDRLVREYLELHDAPKLMSRVALTRHQYSLEGSILELLAKYYGINRVKNNLSIYEQSEMDAVIGELNRIERGLKDQFFVENGLGDLAQDSIKRLELVSDLVDTGFTRFKEMGVSAEKALASNFYTGDADTMRMIIFAESIYHADFNRPIVCQEMLATHAFEGTF